MILITNRLCLPDATRLLVAETSESGEVKGTDADARQLMARPAPNVIDFGSVHINEKVRSWGYDSPHTVETHIDSNREMGR